MILKINANDVINASSNPYEFARALNDSARVQAKSGKTVGATIDLVDSPAQVYAILAFVTATGAPAAKCLLASGTDFTVSDNILTFVTDQSANSLVIIYRV
jgi:hypothetical protein